MGSIVWVTRSALDTVFFELVGLPEAHARQNFIVGGLEKMLRQTQQRLAGRAVPAVLRSTSGSSHGFASGPNGKSLSTGYGGSLDSFTQ